jgi:hypothetical protein
MPSSVDPREDAVAVGPRRGQGLMKLNRRIGTPFSLVAGIALALSVVAPDASAYISGDGKGKPETDCFIGLEGYEPEDLSPFGRKGKPAIQCTDCDPACDLDGVAEPNGSCTFSIAVRVNDPNVPGCTPAPLKKVKVKAKTKGTKITSKTSFQVALDGSSATSAFVDFPVLVKKFGKPKEKAGKGKVVMLAKKPKDKDKFLIVCNPLPAGEQCPGATTTTTISSTTTTTTLPCPAPGPSDPTHVKFTNSLGSDDCGGATQDPMINEGVWTEGNPPFSGQILDADDNVLGNLGLSCLYLGGGAAFNVPPGANPDNATSVLAVSGVCPDGSLELVPDPGSGPTDCTIGPETTSSCIDELPATESCTTNEDCTPGSANSGACAPDANCFFGAPLAIENGGLSTCVINVILDGAGGTTIPTLGESSLRMPLQSRVYLTGNGGAPCPTCIANVCDPDWRAGTLPSPNAGEACTADATSGVTHDCLPAGTFVGRIPVDLTPLTTDETVLESDPNATACGKSPEISCATAGDCPTVCSGTPNTVFTTTEDCPAGQTCGSDKCTAEFCPGQVPSIGPGLYGAFGLRAARKIIETGMPAGDITGGPASAILASTFCIPATGNGLIDGSADLPGPGATSLPGIMELVVPAP